MLQGFDHKVENLISELNRTGHVSHSKWKKKSVTLHHNGGVLTHQQVLNLWKTREASAHFDVDSLGAYAQYVECDEYAWAVGDTQGNEETISIEMCNKTASPHWEVSETTWGAAARLAGFLFAHVIEGHPRPSTHNLLPHHHWSATTCPGPYVDDVFPKIIAAAQHWYEHYMTAKQGSTPTKKPAAKKPDQKKSHTLTPVEQIQIAVGMTEKQVDGKWGPQTDREVLIFRKKHLGKF